MSAAMPIALNWRLDVPDVIAFTRAVRSAQRPEYAAFSTLRKSICIPTFRAVMSYICALKIVAQGVKYAGPDPKLIVVSTE